MRKIAKGIIKFRYVIVGIFLLGAVLCYTLMDNVTVNYDNSKYLPSDSRATIDMNYINGEIGLPSTISLMIKDISISEANTIKDSIQDIDDISVVIFDPDNGNFVDGNALMTIMLSKDVTNTEVVLDEISDTLSTYDISISGEAANLVYQQQRIIDEVPIALIASIVIILVILLLTTNSYLEPFVFMIVIGISIVINLGTNIMFDYISYITKSIVAILQLGLSMDYSIMLLQSYYREKEECSDSKEAMINAFAHSTRTIVSSSLTTVIGLLALCFMTSSIGTDIGLVLAKGIIISLISVLLLLPILILWVEKIPFNKTHKTVNISGLSLRKSSKKFSFIFTIVAVLFIFTMFFLQTKNTYSFVDATKYSGEQEIKKVFGSTNTFVVGIVNDDLLEENEQKILAQINAEYDNRIINYLGISDSLNQPLDYSALTPMVTNDESKMIFALYALDDGFDYTMTYEQYIATLETLLETNKDMNSEDIQPLLDVIQLNHIKDNSYSLEELAKLLDSLGVLESNATNTALLDSIYGLYAYNNSLISDTTVSPLLYLNVLQAVASETFTTEQAANLETLITSLGTLNQTLSSDVTQEEFQYLMASQFGASIETDTVENLYQNYFAVNQIPTSDTITLHFLLNFIVDHQLLSADMLLPIAQTLQVEQLAVSPSTMDLVVDTINTLIMAVDPSAEEIIIPDSYNSLVYVQALSALHRYDDISFPLSAFISTTQTLSTDSLFAAMMDEEITTTIATLETQMTLLHQNTVYHMSDMIAMLSPVPNAGVAQLSEAIYAISLSATNQLESYTIKAQSLLTYISNSTLIPLTASETKTVADLQEELTIIRNLISSDDVSLLIINTSFPAESEETREFIGFMYDEVLPSVDADTYFIGSSVSNLEIQDCFEQDLLRINLITIGAILVILIITFRSFIIPFILVFVIEGAIWTTLSVSYITSTDIFFICYVIIGAIQLGATIDYAIVLTHNYQTARKETDKSTALSIALKKSTPTILTSGLILIVAGGTIGLLMSQATVAEVGNFISRGAFISVIAVLIVLPSFLYTLDSFILKHDKTPGKIIKK